MAKTDGDARRRIPAWWITVAVNTSAYKSRAVHAAHVKEGLLWLTTVFRVLTLMSVIYQAPAVSNVGIPGAPTSASATLVTSLALTTSPVTVSNQEGRQIYLLGKKKVFS